MSHFEVVGKPLELGEVHVSLRESETLRQIALELPIKKLDITEDTCRMITAVSAIEDPLNQGVDARVKNIVLVCRLFGATEGQGFSSTLFRFSSFRDSQRDTKIHEVYRTDTYGGEVMSATRTLYVARDVGRIASDGRGRIIPQLNRQYKQIDRPMFSYDLGVVEDRTRRLLARASV